MRRGTSWRATSTSRSSAATGSSSSVNVQRRNPVGMASASSPASNGASAHNVDRSVDTTPSPPSHVVAAASASSVWLDSKGIRRTDYSRIHLTLAAARSSVKVEMNILIIGDVVGSPGRSIMKKALPLVLKKYDVDYCIANVENAAGGFGVTREICDEILDMGVDCMTSGNHIWDKR